MVTKFFGEKMLDTVSYKDVLEDVRINNSFALVLYDDEKDGDKNDYFEKEITRMNIPPIVDRKICNLAENKPILQDEYALPIFDYGNPFKQKEENGAYSGFYTPRVEYIFFNRKKEGFDHLFLAIARYFLFHKQTRFRVVFMDDENNPEVWGRDEFVDYFLKNRGKAFQENGIKKYASTEKVSYDDMDTVEIVPDITETILESNSDEPVLYLVEYLTDIKKMYDCLEKIAFTGSVLYIKHCGDLTTVGKSGNGNKYYGTRGGLYFAHQVVDMIAVYWESKELFELGRY